MKKNNWLLALSLIKYVVLFGIFLILVKAMRNTKMENGQTILEYYASNVNVDNFIELFNKFVNIMNYYFGFALLLNVISILVINKSKNEAVVKALGLLKILSLSFVSGIALLLFKADNKKNKDTCAASENVISNFNNTKAKKRLEPIKKYNFPSAILNSLVWLFFVIIFFLFTKGMSKLFKVSDSTPSTVIIVGTIVFFVIRLIPVIGLICCFYSCLCGNHYYRKALDKAEDLLYYGMTIDEVRDFMQNIRIQREGVNNNGDYVIIYSDVKRKKRDKDYESLVCVFKDGKLCDIDRAYRRTIVYN
mgnify:CR=1 FL=1